MDRPVPLPPARPRGRTTTGGTLPPTRTSQIQMPKRPPPRPPPTTPPATTANNDNNNNIIPPTAAPRPPQRPVRAPHAMARSSGSLPPRSGGPVSPRRGGGGPVSPRRSGPVSPRRGGPVSPRRATGTQSTYRLAPQTGLHESNPCVPDVPHRPLPSLSSPVLQTKKVPPKKPLSRPTPSTFSAQLASHPSSPVLLSSNPPLAPLSASPPPTTTKPALRGLGSKHTRLRALSEMSQSPSYKHSLENMNAKKKPISEQIEKLQQELADGDESYKRDLLASVGLFQVGVRHVAGQIISQLIFEHLLGLAKFHAKPNSSFGQKKSVDDSFSVTLRLLHASHLYEEYVDNYQLVLHTVGALENDSFFHFHLRESARSSAQFIAVSAQLRDLLHAPILRINAYVRVLNQLSTAIDNGHRYYRDTQNALTMAKSLQKKFTTDPLQQPQLSAPLAQSGEWVLRINQKCADCGNPDVEFVSTTLPAVLCSSCAQAHQSLLPPNVSIIEPATPESFQRATSWGNNPKAADIIMFLSRYANTVLNAVWEHNLPQGKKLTPECSTEERTTYLKEKYLERKYFHKDYGFMVKLQEKKGTKKYVERFIRIEPGQNGTAKMNIFLSLDSSDPPTSLLLKETKVSFVDEDPAKPQVHIDHLSRPDKSIIIDCSGRHRALMFTFSLHRAEAGVMDASVFDLTTWLDSTGWFQAIENQSMVPLQEYLSQSPSYCNLTTQKGQTAAHLACSQKNLNFARLLAQKGADFTVSNAETFTPLLILFGREWGDEEVAQVKEFLDELCELQPGVTLNGQGGPLASTLLHAATRTSNNLIPVLLAHHVDLDIQNKEGFTPFMLALTLGLKDVILQLFESGADLFIRCPKGDALSLAKEVDDEIYNLLFERYEERRTIQIENIVQEIIDTEKAFCSQMEALVLMFLEKMASDLSLTPRAIQSIFSNAQEIHKRCTLFLADLSGVTSLPVHEQDVGRRFLMHLSYFELFTQYCKNQTVSAKSLKLILTQPEIHDWITLLYATLTQEGVQESIEGFLIKPVQRICRYPLLLRELLKYVDQTNEDYPLLVQLNDKLAEILQAANEQKRRLDHIDEVVDILSSLGVVFSKTCVYVEEGPIKVVMVEKDPVDCSYFLFNEVLILATGEHPNWNPLDILLFSDNLILFKKEESDVCFDVVRREMGKPLTLEVSSAEERDILMEKLGSHISSVGKDERKKEKSSDGEDTETDEQLPELQRPIFVEEIFVENACVGGESRREVSIDAKLARRVGMGIETEDPSILKNALGKGENMQALRNILERVCEVGEEPGKGKHSFHKHHFRAPRWCDYCKKFIYGLTYQGNKCKTCAYSAHFKCSNKVGKSCLTPTAMDVWKKRDAVDISTALFSTEKSETPKQTALLLFQDTLEILVEHDGSSSGQKNKFLAPLVSFALNERILASTNEQTVVLEKPSQTEESSEFVYLKCQRHDLAASLNEKITSCVRRMGPKRSNRASFTPTSLPIDAKRMARSLDEPVTLSCDNLEVESSPFPPQKPRREKREEYTLAYDFEKMGERELDLKQGDRVAVTEKEGEWWKGYKVDNPEEEGWFPSNYIQ